MDAELRVAVADLMCDTVNRLLDGDLLAERSLRELRGRLAAAPNPAVGAVVDGIDVMRLIRAGRLDTAEAWAAEHARRDRRAGDPNAAERHAWQLLATYWYRGRVGELAPVLSDLGPLALAAAAAGEERPARQALARVHRTGLLSGGLVAGVTAVEAAYLLRDQATAAEAYRLLLPYADRPAVAALGCACLGSVQHALGVAALTQGEPEHAVAHLAAAVYDNLALGHWPATIVARTRLAQALDLVGRPAGGERDLAARDAAELGLPAPELAWPAVPAAAPRGIVPVSCRKRGRQWEITMGRRSVRVEHLRGLPYLAILLANPGQEIRSAELAGGLGLAPAAPPSHQPVLDDAAVREYRRRLDDLDGRPADDEERQWLLAELAAATGLAGRARTFSTSDERARLSVGKAIRRALDRITTADPILGAQLRAAVRTGTRCVYQPSG